MSPSGTQPKRNYFWPSVATPEEAAWAVKQAFWAAVFCAVLTSVAAILAIAGVQFVKKTFGIDGSALVDAAIFGVVAFFLARHSRVAAWTGLVVYCLERVYMWATVPASRTALIMPVIFILAFIGGVRGAQALHRFRQTPLPGQIKKAA
jgi:hypothetical protein